MVEDCYDNKTKYNLKGQTLWYETKYEQNEHEQK